MQFIAITKETHCLARWIFLGLGHLEKCVVDFDDLTQVVLHALDFVIDDVLGELLEIVLLQRGGNPLVVVSNSHQLFVRLRSSVLSASNQDDQLAVRFIVLAQPLPNLALEHEEFGDGTPLFMLQCICLLGLFGGLVCARGLVGEIFKFKS